jgi:D-alanyl-D-alanine carboxypeptidase
MFIIKLIELKNKKLKNGTIKLLGLFLFISISYFGCSQTSDLRKPLFWKIDEKQVLNYDLKQHTQGINITPETEFSSPEKAILESTLDTVYAHYNTNYMSAAVFIPGKGLWKGIRTGKNLTKSDLFVNPKFHAASIGKLFTSVIILQLIEEGKISLNDRITKWFPDIYPGENITIQNLLHHTSGIPSFDMLKDYKRQKYYTDLELISLVRNYDLNFKPGTYYSYCNTGYVLLGMIAEKITGKNYASLLRERIIDPAGLKETEVISNLNPDLLKLRGNRSGAIIENNENYANPHAAGAVITTPGDLVIFLSSLFSGKQCKDISVKSLFTGMNLIGTNPNVYYGKGITVIKDTPSGDYIGHSGGFPGFLSALYFQPDKNIFVCVMTNDDGKPVEPAMFKMAECFGKK